MPIRKLGLLLGFVALVLAVVASGAAASSGTPSIEPQLIQDSQLQALTTTEGGAAVTPTTRTIPHWWGSTLDPHNGVTSGYNMVGADPNNCSGSACDKTIEADITPLIVNIDGMTFSGNDVLAATLASPQFAMNDYGSTPFASAGAPNVPRGPGGVLSQTQTGQQLQLEDATMRSQFNKGGSSNYHVRLHANPKPAVVINVPNNQGTLLVSGRGVVFADITSAGGRGRSRTSSRPPTRRTCRST